MDIDEVVKFTPIEDDSQDSQTWPASTSSSSVLQPVAPWAARSQQNPLRRQETEPLPKLASAPLNDDDDNVSLSDIADIIEDDFFFEKLIKPIPTKNSKSTTSEFSSADLDNQLQPVEALLPGGLNKTPKIERRTLPALPSRPIHLTPSKHVQQPLKSIQDNIGGRHKIPDEWMMICERENFNLERSLLDCFPEDFYEALFTDDERISKDYRIKQSYERFTAFIFESIYGPGSSLNSVSNLGPNIIMKGFKNITKNTNWPPELQNCIQKAFRYSVKIAIDKSVLGSFDNEELLDAMEDVHQNWFVGLETEPEWASSVRAEVPNLFCLYSTSCSENGQMTYRFKMTQ